MDTRRIETLLENTPGGAALSNAYHAYATTVEWHLDNARPAHAREAWHTLLARLSANLPGPEAATTAHHDLLAAAALTSPDLARLTREILTPLEAYALADAVAAFAGLNEQPEDEP